MGVALGLQAQGLRQNGRWKRGSVPDSPGIRNKTWADAVSQAGVVLDHAPDLAGAVMAEAESLDSAYRTACDRRDRAKRLEATGDLAAT